jgi:hypothetical protein
MTIPVPYRSFGRSSKPSDISKDEINLVAGAMALPIRALEIPGGLW